MRKIDIINHSSLVSDDLWQVCGVEKNNLPAAIHFARSFFQPVI
jgi:hypothetical protein